ncbi:histidinol-phosphatase [Paenibacillus sp. HJGM_3]|uniref:histidinol-phosphatase n=1 Tax=Paenibacillus sp. HJGM_3 TaxID=3379816 RepID=UPI00385DAF03
MRFDYHTHHTRCGHATGDIRDYIEAAIERGLTYIGISDHSPFFGEEADQFRPGIAMAKSEFPNYVREVLRLKEEYRGRITVLLGVESDFFPEHAEIYREVYAAYPLDYIIGSVHVSGGRSIFDRTRWEGIDDAGLLRDKEAHFRLVAESARSGMFDILGHIDAIKGYRPDISEVRTSVVDETLRTIAEHDVAIEINTSGKGKSCGGWYPSFEILERACHFGVKPTFGSDSHTPERVADEFDEVRDVLKRIGFKEWAVFEQRQRKMVAL